MSDLFKPREHGKQGSGNWNAPKCVADPATQCGCGCKCTTPAGAIRIVQLIAEVTPMQCERLDDPTGATIVFPLPGAVSYHTGSLSISKDPTLRYYLNRTGDDGLWHGCSFVNLKINGKTFYKRGLGAGDCGFGETCSAGATSCSSPSACFGGTGCDTTNGINYDDCCVPMTESCASCFDVTDWIVDGVNTWEFLTTDGVDFSWPNDSPHCALDTPVTRLFYNYLDCSQSKKTVSDCFTWLEYFGKSYPGQIAFRFKGNTDVWLWSVPVPAGAKAIGFNPCCCVACCLPDGTCAPTDPQVCANRFGSGHGDANCNDVSCGAPCCFAVVPGEPHSGGCQFLLEQDCCTAGGGTWNADAGTCTGATTTFHAGAADCCDLGCGNCGGCSEPPVQVGIEFAAFGGVIIPGNCEVVGGGQSESYVAGSDGADASCISAITNLCDQGPCKIGNIIHKQYHANMTCAGTPSITTPSNMTMTILIITGVIHWSIDSDFGNLCIGTGDTTANCKDCYGPGTMFTCDNDGNDGIIDCTKVTING